MCPVNRYKLAPNAELLVPLTEYRLEAPYLAHLLLR